MKPLVALLLTAAMLAGCWAPHQKSLSITADVLEVGGIAAVAGFAHRGTCDDPDFCTITPGQGLGLIAALVGVVLQPFVLWYAVHESK